MSEKDGTLFTRDFMLCTMILFFCVVMFFMTYTGMTSYVKLEFGTDSALAAVTVSLFIVGDLVARLLSGKAIAAIGLKNLIALSLAASTVLSLLYFVVWDVSSMSVLRFLHGMTYGAASTAVNTKVARTIPSERMGEGMGYFMLSMSIGSAVGPMLSMILDDDGIYTDIFMIGFVMSLIGTVFAVLLSGDKGEPGPTRDSKGLIERSALPISIVALVFFLAYSGVLSFMSPFGDHIGLGSFATFFFVALSISTLLSRMFLGKVYDVRGENILLIPSFILFIAGMVLMATTDNGWVLLISGAMMGVNVAMLVSAGNSIVIKLTSADRVAVAISTFNIFIDLAYVIGPVIHGSLIDEIGYQENYLVMAGVAVVSLIMYCLLHGRLVASGKIPKGSVKKD